MTGGASDELTLEREDWRLVHVVHHDREGPNEISTAIAYAVADAAGVDPIELVPPLATVIDLDAIDGLFAIDTGSERRVEFRYGPYKVVVRSDDRIRVYEPRAPTGTD